MTLLPGPIFATSQAPISIEISGIIPPGGVTQLGVSIESSASSGNIQQRIEAYNFTTQQFVSVGASQLTTVDTNRNHTIGNSPSHTGPGGRLRLRVSYILTGPTFSYPWRVYIDKLRWTR